MSKVVYKDDKLEGSLIYTGDYVFCKDDNHNELWGMYNKKLELIIGLDGKTTITISEEDMNEETNIYVGMRTGKWEVKDYIKNEKASITIERS